MNFLLADAAPPPPQVVEAPELSTEEADRREAERRRFGAFFDVGPTYRRIYGVGSYGGVGRLGLGTTSSKLMLAVFVDLYLGRTIEGLSVQQTMFGFMAEFAVGSGVWISAGLQAGVLSVARVTATANLAGPGLGVFGGIQYDALTFGDRDRHALYVGLRLDGNIFAGHESQGPFVWGPTFAVGLRL